MYSRGPLNPERAVECSSLRFRVFSAASDFLLVAFVGLDLLRLAHVVSIIALLVVLLGYSLACTTF